MTVPTIRASKNCTFRRGFRLLVVVAVASLVGGDCSVGGPTMMEWSGPRQDLEAVCRDLPGESMMIVIGAGYEHNSILLENGRGIFGWVFVVIRLLITSVTHK